MKYLLDTNICIYIIKQRPEWVAEKFHSLSVESVGISSITSSELFFGVAKSSNVGQNQRALAEFLAPLTVVPYDQQAAPYYGQLRASLEKSGQVIGSLDMLIAAHALRMGVILVTNNLGEFQRVEGLQLENWADEPTS